MSFVTTYYYWSNGRKTIQNYDMITVCQAIGTKALQKKIILLF